MVRGSSVVGLTFDATVAWPVYDWMGVAKAALESTSRYLARDLGPEGIRCNLVAAGPIRSTAAKAIPGFEAIEGGWDARAPLGWDVGDAGPTARAVVALLSDWFPATTGEIVHVDGGVARDGDVTAAVGPGSTPTLHLRLRNLRSRRSGEVRCRHPRPCRHCGARCRRSSRAGWASPSRRGAWRPRSPGAGSSAWCPAPRWTSCWPAGSRTVTSTARSAARWRRSPCRRSSSACSSGTCGPADGRRAWRTRRCRGSACARGAPSRSSPCSANFVEVWLAKEGHDGPVGINYLEKVQMAMPAAVYGAMLAGRRRRARRRRHPAPPAAPARRARGQPPHPAARRRRRRPRRRPRRRRSTRRTCSAPTCRRWTVRCSSRSCPARSWPPT